MTFEFAFWQMFLIFTAGAIFGIAFSAFFCAMERD